MEGSSGRKGGGDGRLKRTRPLEPERWEKDGRIARSIRTRVHRRAKVARAEIFNIYIYFSTNETDNIVLACEIYTLMSRMLPPNSPFFFNDRVWITVTLKRQKFKFFLSFVIHITRSPRVKWKIDPVTYECIRMYTKELNLRNNDSLDSTLKLIFLP